VALAGYLLVLMERRGNQNVRWFLLPGFCGGMTTFSAVTIEVVGENAQGFGYLVLTAVASLITIVIAIAYGRATIKVKQ
jgi:CrcB protein